MTPSSAVLTAMQVCACWRDDGVSCAVSCSLFLTARFGELLGGKFF